MISIKRKLESENRKFNNCWTESISYALKTLKPYVKYNKSLSCRRKRKTSGEINARVAAQIKENRFITGSQVVQKIKNGFETEVTPKMVKRRIKEHGFYG